MTSSSSSTDSAESLPLEHLVDEIYDELRRKAHFELVRLPPGQTLNTTGLVHEMYLKLAAGQRAGNWRDPAHFLAAAAQAMRHILVDAARRRLSARKGHGKKPATLDEALVARRDHATRVLAVDQALDKLRKLDERLAKVVECRFFAGMTEDETATALDVSARTVHRDWLRARGWLRRHLGRASAP